MTIDTLEAIQAGGTTPWIRVRGADANGMEPGPGDGPLPSVQRRIADIEHSFDRLNVATPTDKFASRK